ncbi:Uma2 family endonuclease [Saccharothrix coeruleofusca]|uniref:Putative restriction endonuclease domain-containing protein n=1 Tax=Saccharothrix coeruleofusca TaxID=33919 RepID=A0A918EHP8_9PSEU|nr:Uma2 family endonuclease [Saccharothrix coeruleofusca]MBP2337011.1 Uma2 family endonuclease [Saccharothrix coeruleofusca]GGP83830.1 hypothetical protein GCM10010185_67140 [Saccharothrix coeruleofusca]
MAAPAHPPFDPLVDLAGMWTTDLAERYLPIDGVPPAKYECVDGRLILSPYEAGPNTYAAAELRDIVKPAARKAGLRVYTTLNVRFGAQRWIQPDFAVVRSPVEGVWVDVEDVVLVGEFVSPTSRRRDRIDKPALCASEGVEYYLFGEADLRRRFASLRLSALRDGVYQVVADARSGERFEVDDPFEISLDPTELLDL